MTLKKTIFILITIFTILFAFLAHEIFIGRFGIEQNRKNAVFEQCKNNIDTSQVPKNAKEYKKFIDRKNMPYFTNYFSDDNESYKGVQGKHFELGKILGDKPDKNSFIGFWPKNEYNLYFSHEGKLLYIEKEYNLTGTNYGMNEMPLGFGVCKYNSKGLLIELAYINNELLYAFNNKGQFLYKCNRNFCSDYYHGLFN